MVGVAYLFYGCHFPLNIFLFCSEMVYYINICNLFALHMHNSLRRTILRTEEVVNKNYMAPKVIFTNTGGHMLFQIE
jgi:hypothetical protein